MVKKHSLKIKVSLKRTLGIGFTALLSTSSLGFSGACAMKGQFRPADFFDLNPGGTFFKFWEEKGKDISGLSLENKEELLKCTLQKVSSQCVDRWPKFLGEGVNPSEVLHNFLIRPLDFEVLDFIDKNYDEIRKKLPSDWLAFVKELYELSDEQVNFIRKCIGGGFKVSGIYNAEMYLEDYLDNKNMVFQYFVLCRSKTGGSLSLEETKNKMDDKEFFKSRIKQIFSYGLDVFFTKEEETKNKMDDKEFFKSRIKQIFSYGPDVFFTKEAE